MSGNLLDFGLVSIIMPNYNSASWKYNGVSVDSLTEQDIIDFYNACVNYEKEYEEAEAKIEYPSLEEITAQCERITAKAEAEYKQASQLVVEAVLDGTITKLSDYEIKELKNSLKYMQSAVNNNDPKTYPSRIYRKSSSFDFVKPDHYYLKNKSWYLEQIEKYMKKIKNN